MGQKHITIDSKGDTYEIKVEKNIYPLSVIRFVCNNFNKKLEESENFFKILIKKDEKKDFIDAINILKVHQEILEKNKELLDSYSKEYLKSIYEIDGTVIPWEGEFNQEILKKNIELKKIGSMSDSEFKRYRSFFLNQIKDIKDIDIDDIRRNSIRHNRLLIGPETIEIYLANRCNYNCEFCYVKDKVGISKRLPKEKIKEIIDDAKDIAVQKIILGGYGEPLYDEGSIEIINYITEKGLKVEILTNLLNGKYLDKIKNPEKVTLLVNLNSSNKESYKNIHGIQKDNFDKIISNIKQLNEITIKLSYVIYNQNYKNIREYIELAKKLNIKNIEFKFGEFVLEDQKRFYLNEKQEEELIKDIESIIKYSENIDTNLKTIKEIISSKKPNLIKRCFNSWFYLKINENLEVFNCCRETIPLGNLKETSLKDIYFSEKNLKRAIDGKQNLDTKKKEWSKCNNDCFWLKRNLNPYRI